VEDEMTIDMAIGLIHQVRLGTFAPYQMAYFLFEFKIIDINSWFDLSFKQAKQILENLLNNG
jgi:hypothetical protein